MNTWCLTTNQTWTPRRGRSAAGEPGVPAVQRALGLPHPGVQGGSGEDEGEGRAADQLRPQQLLLRSGVRLRRRSQRSCTPLARHGGQRSRSRHVEAASRRPLRGRAGPAPAVGATALSLGRPGRGSAGGAGGSAVGRRFWRRREGIVTKSWGQGLATMNAVAAWTIMLALHAAGTPAPGAVGMTDRDRTPGSVPSPRARGLEPARPRTLGDPTPVAPLPTFGSPRVCNFRRPRVCNFDGR